MKKLNRKFRDFYSSVEFPFRRFISLGRKAGERRVWRFDIRGLLFDPIEGIVTGAIAWDRDIIPSYRSALSSLFDNIMIFLTPFFRPRRAMMEAVYNNNDTKLLHFDRKRTCIRNRRRDCVYLAVRCGLLRADVTTTRYVKDGKGVCTFLFGSDGTVPEIKTVASGLCITWKQCEKLLNEVVNSTPEMDWF